MLLLPAAVPGQELTGVLTGTVRDEQGGGIASATVEIRSPALIGGSRTATASAKAHFRFANVPPGPYSVVVSSPGFESYHRLDVPISVSAATEIVVVLQLAGVVQSVEVEGSIPRMEDRHPGVGTRFTVGDLDTMPTRRSGLFDWIRMAPGISPTSPSSGFINSISSFGSATNENAFLIDGTDFTSPTNGAPRADPGADFIEEVHVQAVGASVEYGGIQGAVVNAVTKQGGDRFALEASYYGQPASLTGGSVRLPVPGTQPLESRYVRAVYRDFSTGVGGPIVRNRAWFFAGYQYVRDEDSQPGTDAGLPRVSAEDNMFGKLTWRPAPGWQLTHSVHNELWVNGEQPTVARPFETTLRVRGSVPAVTLAHLTHTWSSNTVWDVRVGRFAFSQLDAPSVEHLTLSNRFDQVTKLSSGGPPQVGNLEGTRVTAKATLSRYQAGSRVDHDWKVGGEIEDGAHRSLRVIPTGVRFVDEAGSPAQAISSEPSNAGGRVAGAAIFVSDIIRFADRLTFNAGLRFDHSRAISQDLALLDSDGRDTGATVGGLGVLYTFNALSPRAGWTVRLGADGRTLLSGSYGRYHQGVMTGEISPLHPGVTTMVTRDLKTGLRLEGDGRNLEVDRQTRAPRTDEYSIGVDRQVGKHLAVAMAYVHKDGARFIGWKDVAGRYVEETRPLRDGRSVPVLVLAADSPVRRYRLTNREDYSLTYDGVVLSVDKRRADSWQAFGSYTLSRAYGLQASSGASAAAAQVSTVGAPPLVFGRDPNDDLNARGRLSNDRPHMLRFMGATDMPRTGLTLAGTLQHVSGKPWAATGLMQLPLPQSRNQRVLLEPRGSRRLSSQTLVDIRLSRSFALGHQSRVELRLDVLNALDDSAQEGLVTDELGAATFAQPSVFVDPRRVMLSVRLNLDK